MLVREKDRSVIVQRLFLTESGIGSQPCSAQDHNKELAYMVNRWLDAERRLHISFGKLPKVENLLFKTIFRVYQEFKQFIQRHRILK